MRTPSALRYPLGLDLGQSRDHTALTALDLCFLDHGRSPWDMSRLAWPCLRLLYAARLPLSTDYIYVPEHVSRVIQEIHRRQPFPGQSRVQIDLYVDSGGPGRPVVDLLRGELLTASLHGCQREHDDLAISLALAVWAVSHDFPDLRKPNPYVEKLQGVRQPAA